MPEETEMQEYDEQTGKRVRKVRKEGEAVSEESSEAVSEEPSEAVSEESSESCHVDLSEHGVAMQPEKKRSKWVEHRRTADMDTGAIRRSIHEGKKVKVGINIYQHDIPLSTKGFIKAAKNDVKSSLKSSFKPGATVGIISGKS